MLAQNTLMIEKLELLTRNKERVAILTLQCETPEKSAQMAVNPHLINIFFALFAECPLLLGIKCVFLLVMSETLQKSKTKTLYCTLL